MGDSSQQLVPPENFAMVWKGIYRSGFPTKKNLPFLRTIGIRSVLCLCPEDYPESSLNFFEVNDIDLIQHGVDGNKAPDDRDGAYMNPATVARAVAELMDESTHPVLIHCNQGKHRTGCLVGCLRKVQRWSLVAIFEEYRRFAGEKARLVDLQFIELFDISTIPSPQSKASTTAASANLQKLSSPSEKKKDNKDKKKDKGGTPIETMSAVQ
ncbi:tyrosine phosphatase family-domain-containing protein [Pavlovales sp. CCMP2436]|nr:tyrosine phosphatase family-domain-containing protein [Pavlovales sp. CCMP2436]